MTPLSMYLIEDATTGGWSPPSPRRVSCACLPAGGGGGPDGLRGARGGGALRAPLPLRGAPGTASVPGQRSGHRFRSGMNAGTLLRYARCRHPLGGGNSAPLLKEPAFTLHYSAALRTTPPLQRSPTHPLHYSAALRTSPSTTPPPSSWGPHPHPPAITNVNRSYICKC